MTKQRNSNIELLRLIALWMIVAYHTIAFCVYHNYPDAGAIYKAIWLPLHIGVVLFILISGYFGIKPSAKGFVRLLSYMFIYTVPLGLIQIYQTGGGIIDVLKKCMFVSNTPFWFMRPYLCLYLAAPIINRLLEKSTTKQLIQTILILSFIAVYLGLTRFDHGMLGGKNVVNFSLIYILGFSIRKYRLWEKMKKWQFLVVFIIINALEMLIYIVFAHNIVGEGFFWLCFQYCSPALIINGVLFFCFFLGLRQIKSNVINWLASSALAIYFIHTIVLYGVISPIACSIYEYNSHFLFVFPTILLLSAIVSLGCIFIDKLLFPVWYLTSKMALPIEKIVGVFSAKIARLSDKLDDGH